jgi:hypothetical protein
MYVNIVYVYKCVESKRDIELTGYMLPAGPHNFHGWVLGPMSPLSSSSLYIQLSALKQTFKLISPKYANYSQSSFFRF